MTYCQGHDGSWDRRKVFAPKPRIYKVQRDQKFPQTAKHSKVFNAWTTTQESQTTCQRLDDSLLFFGWRLRNREHSVPLYLLWKTALHLCGLLCKWLWCIWWGPKFLGSRLHKWDFCETLSRCSPFGPLWSFGTPSMASMATSTTSKHTICILTFVRFASQVTADGYSMKFQVTEKSESRIFLKVYKKRGANFKHYCTSQQKSTMLLPSRSPRYINPRGLGQSPKSCDSVSPPEHDGILMRAALYTICVVEFTPLSISLSTRSMEGLSLILPAFLALIILLLIYSKGVCERSVFSYDVSMHAAGRGIL